MDIRALSYFVAAAEELNITKAAARLNMSQPPLSSQIKALEEELDTVLFIRGKRQLKLTEAGQLLYRRAKEILTLTEKAGSEIRSLNLGMTGTISVGLVEGMATDIAAGWFAGFMKQYPNIRFRILDGNSDDLIEKLRSGIISLAVITAPFDASLLNGFTVGSEKLTAFMRKDHRLALASGSTVSIKDLQDEKLIVPSRKALIENIYRWFRTIRTEPHIVCEMDSYLDASALAVRGVGVSIFPKTACIPNDSIVAKEIEGDEKKLDYIFSWRKGHPLPKIEEDFIDYVRMNCPAANTSGTVNRDE